LVASIATRIRHPRVVVFRQDREQVGSAVRRPARESLACRYRPGRRRCRVWPGPSRGRASLLQHGSIRRAREAASSHWLAVQRPWRRALAWLSAVRPDVAISGSVPQGNPDFTIGSPARPHPARIRVDGAVMLWVDRDACGNRPLVGLWGRPARPARVGGAVVRVTRILVVGHCCTFRVC